MHKSRYLLLFLIVLLCRCSLSAEGRGSSNSGRLFSLSVGQAFYEIAYESANRHDVSRPEVEQAIVFLNAAKEVDVRAKYVLADMLRLASKYPDRDYSELVHELVWDYLDESAELGVARRAVQYLLDQLDYREQREVFINVLLGSLGNKNAVLSSELATLLGILMAERPNVEAATFYFLKAYQINKYNKLAFAKLEELMPEGISQGAYLEHLRLRLRENPLNLESALAFAQYAEQMELYEVASGAYEYCADLFKYLYPSANMPAEIYLPWALSCYNTKRGHQRCLQIASDIRQQSVLDLVLEAVAGKAAAKMGELEQSRLILAAAAAQADSYLEERQGLQQEDDGQASAVQLAWFYCFGLTDANLAVYWANKAYAADPNSAIAAAILAYSLVLNGQSEWAGPLIEHYDQTQIAKLAEAMIQLSEQQKDTAIETLKSAIAIEPGSLEAEGAKEMLAEYGSQYISPVDTDSLMMALRGLFEENLIPTFLSPEKILSVHLNLRGSKFSYGNEFGGVVGITNNSPEPLVVCDDGLFRGNIRIDAEISGDLSKKIPELVNIKNQSTLPIEPGNSMLVPVRLITGELRQILSMHPQASLDIEFTVYIDPVTGEDGSVTNRLAAIEPLKLAVKRPGIQITSRYLQTRFNSLAKGRQGQKTKTVELFVGLLAEQQAMANREPLYKLTSADWMDEMLRSALLQSLADDNWVVRAHTTATMLSSPMDYELINAISENLNDTHWPVRLITMYSLAKNQGSNFRRVLDHTARYDPNVLVRWMAVALGGKAPQIARPKIQPKQETPQ